MHHKGNVGGRNPGGGNHRGSVFRKHVGIAMLGKDLELEEKKWTEEIRRTWGEGSSAAREIREVEAPLERAVSDYIRAMPFIWLEIVDEPGPNNRREYIERNAIALLSNYCRKHNPIDKPSENWLGKWAKNEKVRESGLWNSDHVDRDCDDQFLDTLRSLIRGN